LEHGVFIAVVVGMILLLFLVGTPFKPLKILGRFSIKLIVGAVILYIVNIVGGKFGMHIPINPSTTLVSGILGLPGIAALIVIQKWIIP
jgi:inhibitor of the pro-sigma K processing machinery